MSEPSVTIRLEGNGRTYSPGESLAGEYWLESLPADQVKAIEVSVMWYTEGKGDEDFAVHDFWRTSVDETSTFDPRSPGAFTTVLPNSPLSYEGQIVKIRWCVRVRAFLARGRELVGQVPFRLGSVPPVRLLAGPPVESPRTADGETAAGAGDPGAAEAPESSRQS